MKNGNLFLAFFSLWLGHRLLVNKSAGPAVGTEQSQRQSAIAVDAASGQFISEESNGAIRKSVLDQVVYSS